MTMDQVKELNAYWRDHPPAHLLIAAYIGFKPRPLTVAESDPDELFRLLGADPNTGGAMRILH